MAEKNLKGPSNETATPLNASLIGSIPRQDMTVCDDQHGFDDILESARACRKNGFRFRLIDTGLLSLSQLEWLGEAGADLYSSDKAREDIDELEFAALSSKKGKALIAYFIHGPLETEKEQAFQELGRKGIYLHVSNRDDERDPRMMVELAEGCRKGKSWLIYYHHGVFMEDFQALNREGAWLHLSGECIRDEESVSLLMEAVKSSQFETRRLVLYINEECDFTISQSLFQAGAHLIFSSRLFDYRSPYRNLERKSRRRKLDFRAYYLYTTFLH